MTTRGLECLAAIGGGTWAIVAEAMPQPDAQSAISLFESLARMSPTAMLAGVCWVLWRRYTTREDAMALLQRENIAALQRVADALERFERNG